MYKYKFRKIHHITAIRSNTPLRQCSIFFLQIIPLWPLNSVCLLSHHLSKRNGFPGWRHRLTRPTLLVTRPCNHSGVYFSNFKNSQKIKQKSYDYNFFTNVIRTIKGSLEQLHGMNCLHHCVTCDLVIFAKFIPLFIGYTCRHNCYVCKKGLT